MQTEQAAKTAFRLACEAVYTDRTSPSTIGTLGERMLHAILKRYLCPDTACHEIKVGTYHADVLCDGHIYEIQTRRLDKLRPKLDRLLEQYDVTVVYPIATEKTLSWLDPETGTLSPARKSPRKGTLYSALYELYSIRELLLHPRFSFRAVLCTMQEYRSLTGYGKDKKRRAPRCERLPGKLEEDVTFSSRADYARLIPPSLGERFTAKEFTAAARIHPRATWRAMQTLTCLGVVRQVGKQGNAYLYERGQAE